MGKEGREEGKREPCPVLAMKATWFHFITED
jgi:hypothetical protein